LKLEARDDRKAHTPHEYDDPDPRVQSWRVCDIDGRAGLKQEQHDRARGIADNREENRQEQ